MNRYENHTAIAKYKFYLKYLSKNVYSVYLISLPKSLCIKRLAPWPREKGGFVAARFIARYINTT